MATFDFANEWTPTNSVEIPDMGNFYLEAIDEENTEYYYLMVKTTLGTASIMWYGPLVPDVTLLPSGYEAKFERMPFNQEKIKGWISKWLNDRTKKITAAYIIDDQKFYQNFRDLQEYMLSYSDEVY